MGRIVARLFAIVFVGALMGMGPLLLVISGVMTVQRLSFLHDAGRAQGQVVALRQAHTKRSSRPAYFPVFRFTAVNGQSYTVTSTNGERRTDWLGKPVPVLYSPRNPEDAHIDTFAQLWMAQMVMGVVGGGFSVIPLVVFLRRRKMRAAQAG
jgi:hypothetical protein